MSNIKDVCCKLGGVCGRHVGHKNSKLEPAIWSCDTSHIGIHGEVDVRSYAGRRLKTSDPAVVCTEIHGRTKRLVNRA